MGHKKLNLSILIVFITITFNLSSEAQQNNLTQRTQFSGEWESKAPISIGGNIYCSYVEGDRMNSKTMKIVDEPNFIFIENPNAHIKAKNTKSRERLNIDGKESHIKYSQGKEKKYTVNFSADGKIMTIESVVYFMAATPYHVNVMKKAFTKVTEVWNLSSNGKHITIQTIAKSNIWNGERSWKTVFDKIN